MTDRYVLLVEDNSDDEALTLRAFRKNSIPNKVVVARSGAEALALLFPGDEAGRARPALILLDLNLPKVGGLEVLQHIRADRRTRHIPVVVLTTSAREEDVVASYNLGANAYVRKPVQFSGFAEAVKTIGDLWLLLTEPMPDVIPSGTR